MSAWSLPLVALAMSLLAGWLTAVIVFVPWNAVTAKFTSLARWSLVIAMLPLAAATAMALAAIIPGDPHLGTLFGCHCATSMPGWVHLCPMHPAGAFGWLLPAVLLISALLPSRIRAWRGLSRQPVGQGVTEPTLLNLPHRTALLVGWWRPSIVIDLALWDGLSASHRAVVLAHEHAHLRRRDPLMLMVLRCLVSLGPAPMGNVLVRSWLDHAERMADAGAANRLGDPLVVADALIRCARISARPLALAWTGGRLNVRIHALLASDGSAEPLGPDVGRADVVLVAVLATMVLANTPWLHHQVEHLLNPDVAAISLLRAHIWHPI